MPKQAATDNGMTTVNKHAFRFAAVGLANTALDYGTFTTLYYVFTVPIVPANLVAASLAVLLSFLLNRHWTFADRKHRHTTTQQFVRHIATSGTGVLLSTVVVWLAAHVAPAYLAKMAAIGISFAWNFSLSRHWVFRAS